MIYLASPYSHEDPTVRELRYIYVRKVLAEQYLMKRNWAYSPIVHYHELAKVYDLPKEHEFWLAADRAMLERCVAMHIVRLDGYETSKGIKSEVQYCAELSIPIVYV